MFLREGGPENSKRTVCGATGPAEDLAGDKELAGLDDCVGLYMQTRAVCHSSLSYIPPICILHIIVQMAEGPGLC
jgi:hypothetical protein